MLVQKKKKRKPAKQSSQNYHVSPSIHVREINKILLWNPVRSDIRPLGRNKRMPLSQENNRCIVIISHHSPFTVQ